MLRKAIYAGTFDPPHRGHLDVIERSRALVDELVIGVGHNPAKRTALEGPERVALLQECVATMSGVRVVSFEGLVVELARQEGISVLVRGFRGAADLDHESPMAWMNQALLPGLETLFVLARPELSAISSSLIKEVASFGGDVRPFLPPLVADRIIEALASV